VRLGELRDIIEASEGSDWNNIPCWGGGSGPSYRERVSSEGQPGNAVVVEAHSNVCSYEPDLDITVAFGFNPHGDDGDLTFGIEDKLGVEKGSISKILVDVFYRGALVDRSYLLYVDGGRGLLPLSSPRRAAGSPSHGPDVEWDHVVSRRKVNFARAIHSIELRPADFDHYLEQSDYIVEG
jgi:hypothetical protein